MKFYKYLSLSNKKSFDFVENYLEQRVWLTPLKDFNDPFEGIFSFKACSPEYILDKPNILNNTVYYLRKNGEPDLTVDDYKSRLQTPEFREAVTKLPNKIVNDMFLEHGALCLTDKNNSIPMWAYYSDNHKGCCIEFELDYSYIKDWHIKNGIGSDENDIKNALESGEPLIFSKKEDDNDITVFAITKIRYSEVIPDCDLKTFLEEQNNEEVKKEFRGIRYIIKNSIGVKYKEWEHENEYRLTTNSNSKTAGSLFLKRYVPFLKITGIIAGSKIKRKKKKRLEKLCKKYNKKLYHASVSENPYHIAISD